MASQTGANVEDAQQALVKLSQATQSVEGIKAFQQIGLEWAKVRDLKPEELFEQVALALGKVGDQNLKNAIAMDLFGKAGVRLIPMVNGYKTLNAEAAKNITFTKEQIAAADAFGDSMARINQSLMSITVGSGFLEWIADVADRLDATIKLLQRAPGRGESGTGKADIADEVMGGMSRKWWVKYNPGLAIQSAAIRAFTSANGTSLRMNTTNEEIVAAIDEHRKVSAEMGKNLGVYQGK
jgi:hypothetical protein